MSQNRNVAEDLAATLDVLQGSRSPHADRTNWLGHQLDSGAAAVDQQLLTGASKQQMGEDRGAIDEHLRHLRTDHGLPLVEADGVWRFDEVELTARVRGRFVLYAKVRDLGHPYADGTPKLEINLPTDSAAGLPFRLGERVPICLRVGGRVYEAGLRSTSQHDKVWFSPDLAAGGAERTTLGEVLTAAGFRANDSVRLIATTSAGAVPEVEVQAIAPTWDQIWFELRNRLSRLPHCPEHEESPCVRTLSRDVINDVLLIDETGVRLRSHETNAERFIPVGDFRAWWEQLHRHGTVEDSVTWNGSVLRAIMARCLPNWIERGEGNLLRLVAPKAEDSLAEAIRRVVNEGGFDPAGIVDARERRFGAIVIRQGQPDFRKRLLEAYRWRCSITGCVVVEVLEAAHIAPYRGAESNPTCNGLLLRSDLHTLFDLGLVSVDERTMTLLVAPKLNGTVYAEYRGRPLALPEDPANRPSVKALQDHRQWHESGNQ